MKRLSVRLFSAAVLFLLLFGFALPRAVQAEAACASGGATIFASSPKFLVHKGDVVQVSIKASNPSDPVEVAILLDASTPVDIFGTGTLSATYTVKSTDHVFGGFSDFGGPPIPSFTWSITINGQCGSSNGPIFSDGRLNMDAAERAAVYCDKGGLDIYTIGDPWTMVLKVTAHDLDLVPTHPAVNTLIKQNANVGIGLYRLTTGELQVNAPGGDDGKGPYIFIFKYTCNRN